MDRRQNPVTAGIKAVGKAVEEPTICSPEKALLQQRSTALSESVGFNDKGQVQGENTAFHSPTGCHHQDETVEVASGPIDGKGKGKARVEPSVHAVEKVSAVAEGSCDAARDSSFPPGEKHHEKRTEIPHKSSDRKGKGKASAQKSPLPEDRLSLVHCEKEDDISSPYLSTPVGSRQEQHTSRINRFERIPGRQQKWREQVSAVPVLHEALSRKQESHRSASQVMCSPSIESVNRRSPTPSRGGSSPFTDLASIEPQSYTSCDREVQHQYLEELEAVDWEHELLSYDPESEQLVKLVQRIVEKHFDHPPRNELEIWQLHRHKMLKIRSRLVVEWVPNENGEVGGSQETTHDEGADGEEAFHGTPERSTVQATSADKFQDEDRRSVLADAPLSGLEGGHLPNIPDYGEFIETETPCRAGQTAADHGTRVEAAAISFRHRTAGSVGNEQDATTLILEAEGQDHDGRKDSAVCQTSTHKKFDHDVRKAFRAVVRRGSFHRRTFAAQIVPGEWPQSAGSSVDVRSAAPGSTNESLRKEPSDCVLPLRPRFHHSVENFLLVPGASVAVTDVTSTAENADSELLLIPASAQRQQSDTPKERLEAEKTSQTITVPVAMTSGFTIGEDEYKTIIAATQTQGSILFSMLFAMANLS
jgi:hypothetical protein